MIDSKDISVIIQGAIKHWAKDTIDSVRKYLPNAEIIVSTWVGENTECLDVDFVIKNNDPGATKYNKERDVLNNCNRQLLSVKSGLQHATRKYSLKLRSDLYLESDSFLYYWDCFNQYDKNFLFFSHKIICSSIYSRLFSDETGVPIPYHPSDFWMFGFTKDLRKYFCNTQMLAQKELGDYEFKYRDKVPYFGPMWRFPPEQYYCISFLKQYINMDLLCDDMSDWNCIKVDNSIKILFSNFIFLGYEQSGINAYSNHKFFIVHENLIPGLITFSKNEEIYHELISGSFIKYQKKYNDIIKLTFWRLYIYIKKIVRWGKKND